MQDDRILQWTSLIAELAPMPTESGRACEYMFHVWAAAYENARRPNSVHDDGTSKSPSPAAAGQQQQHQQSVIELSCTACRWLGRFKAYIYTLARRSLSADFAECHHGTTTLTYMIVLITLAITTVCSHIDAKRALTWWQRCLHFAYDNT